MPLDLDKELIRNAQTGGGAALERVIVSVWSEAFRIAAGILRDRGLAEDAAQEACVSIVQGLPRLKDAGSFAGWSYKIIVNHAISVARSRRRLQPLDTIETCDVRFDSEESLDLARALGTLSLPQRAAVILHYYAGLTSREIAEATGLPRSTIRFHLMLSRRKLREALADWPAQTDSTLSHREVYNDVH